VYTLNFGPVLSNFGELMFGLWTTIHLSVSAMVLGLLVSVICAVGKTSGSRLVVAPINFYIELIRNTPFLVQIFIIYFALPSIGIRMSPNAAALTALVVNVGAYGTEIIRAGIDSIQRGQIEAGYALGLSRGQIYRLIIMKPAIRTIYPALTSQFIYLMLNTSVVSIISATDLAAAGNDIQSRAFTALEVYITISIMYFLLSALFSVIFRALEHVFFSYPLTR